LIAGGGAPEIEVSQKLLTYAKTLKGMEAYCFEAFAEALEVIPTTLAENAGLNPIAIVTELRNRHAKGETTAGINVRKVCVKRFRVICTIKVYINWLYFQGTITNILDENVIQPLLVSTSAIELAAETVKMLLKIDDLVSLNIPFLRIL
jgi:T-complex protein 1 subunit delta